MRILLTNDDGFDAPGLVLLESIASKLGNVTVVAPDEGLSGCGHQMTLDRKMKLVEVEQNRFRLNGMPADCVRVAVAKFGPFDWVFSGVNQGANLGVDIAVSGTVAAVREAAQLRMPGIAFSQYRGRQTNRDDWSLAESNIPRIFAELQARDLCPGEFWNVNFPCQWLTRDPLFTECEVDTMALPMDYSFDGEQVEFCGNYHRRPARPGTDVEHCFAGRITVSKV